MREMMVGGGGGGRRSRQTETEGDEGAEINDH